MDELKLISEVGFPIVISLYLLIRLDNSIKELTDESRKMQKDKTKDEA